MAYTLNDNERKELGLSPKQTTDQKESAKPEDKKEVVKESKVVKEDEEPEPAPADEPAVELPAASDEPEAGETPHEEVPVDYTMEQFEHDGRATEKGLAEGDVDPEQLKMGIEVEMEHTTCAKVATKIALDHLAEIPDYYTRLAQMENEAQAGPAATGEEESKKIKEESDFKSGLVELNNKEVDMLLKLLTPYISAAAPEDWDDDMKVAAGIVKKLSGAEEAKKLCKKCKKTMSKCECESKK